MLAMDGVHMTAPIPFKLTLSQHDTNVTSSSLAANAVGANGRNRIDR